MKKFFLYSFILLAFFGTAGKARAEQGYLLLEPLPRIGNLSDDASCGTGKDATKNSGDFIKCIKIDTYIQYVYKFSIALAVVLAVIMITWGGFEWMISSVPGVKVEARKRINNAVFGLFAALISYLLLQTIDPRLVRVETKLPKIEVKSTQSISQFATQIEKDLQALKADDRNKVVTLDTKIADLEKRRADLIAALKQNGGDVDDQVELDQVEQELAAANIQKIEIFARGGSVTAELQNTFKSLHQIYNYNEVGALNSSTLELNEKTLQRLDEKFNAYLANNIISQNPEAKTLIETEKAFYREQTQEESRFMTVAIRYLYTPPKSTDMPQRERELNEYFDKYSKAYNTVITPEDKSDTTINILRKDPDVPKQYLTILSDRITIINKLRTIDRADVVRRLNNKEKVEI